MTVASSAASVVIPLDGVHRWRGVTEERWATSALPFHDGMTT